MASKAERKRRKNRAKASITMPGGEVIPQVVTNDPRRPRAVDPRQSALKTRLRIAGIPDTPEALKAAVAPDFGHDVGLCIRATVKGDEAAKAWDAFSHLSASYRNYMTLYVGQTGNPQCAAIAMIPEPMETDPSLRVDLRTHEEKVRAAKQSWAAWEARIKALPFPQLRMAINGVLRGFLGDGTLWRDGKPTDTGRTVVAALRVMGA
jgi:hypothetical protein